LLAKIGEPSCLTIAPSHVPTLAFRCLPSHTPVFSHLDPGYLSRMPKVARAHGEDQDELVEAEVGARGHVTEHTGGDVDELLHEHLERELHARGDMGSPTDRERSRMLPFLPSPRVQICHRCTSTRRGQRAYLQAWTKTGIGGGMGEKASEMLCLQCPISPFPSYPLLCPILGAWIELLEFVHGEHKGKWEHEQLPYLPGIRKFWHQIKNTACFVDALVLAQFKFLVPSRVVVAANRFSYEGGEILITKFLRRRRSSTWCCFGSDRCYPWHKRKSLRPNILMEDH
jgi:hypothetical protein